MSRLSGKNGLLYAAIASGGTPSPIAFLNQFSLDFTTDKQDVTCFGDTTKQYVSGFADASGAYAGFFDDATPQLYTAAVDGVARGFYHYINRSNTGLYFFGTAIFDFSISEQVTGGVAISGTWAASTSISKVG